MLRSECISLRKTTHRGREVILMQFNRRYDWLSKVKALKQSIYSATYHSFYIPYEKEAWRQFLLLDIPYELIHNKIENETPIGNAQGVLSDQHISDIDPQMDRHTAVVDNSTPSITDISSRKEGDLMVTLTNKYFHIKTSYNVEIIKKIKKLNKSWWNEKSKTWLCYGSVENMNLIQSLFQCWTPIELRNVEKIITIYDKPCRVTLYQIPQLPGSIIIQINGYKKIINPILRIKDRRYDSTIQRWIIPYHPDVIGQLVSEYKSYGVEVIDRHSTSTSIVIAKPLSNKNRLELLLSKYTDESLIVAREISSLMMSQRYSWHTIKSYTVAIVKYQQWLRRPSISDVEQKDITDYLIYINGCKVSDSYINVQVSALKYYYGKVVSRIDIILEKIKRPRASLVLPRILSQNEVLRMIKSCSNMKHRNILYMLYSSGLRLGELITLKIEDISWDRNQVFVRGAKGKKDRVVMLSDHVKEVFQEYFHKYKPVIYLFESTKAGKKYATSSVQKVMKKSASKADITQKVTPHVLRHSFATHLHDNGVSIAIVQKLLGHKNLKTTLIYTHISIQQVAKIESPLDRIMRKNDTSNGRKVGI